MPSSDSEQFLGESAHTCSHFIKGFFLLLKAMSAATIYTLARVTQPGSPLTNWLICIYIQQILLSAYYVEDTVLHTRNTLLGNQGSDTCPHGEISPEKNTNIKCIITKCDSFNLNVYKFNITTSVLMILNFGVFLNFIYFFIVIQVQLSPFSPHHSPYPSHPHFSPSILPCFGFFHVS